MKYIYITPLLFVFYSCLLLQPSEPENTETPLPVVYDYNPPETIKDDINISILLFKPSFGSSLKNKNLNQRMFAKFVHNMGSDFEEMLLKRGYTIRGPFDSYDNLIYADKSETDLMLEVNLDFNYEWDNNALNMKYNDYTKYYYASISGNLNISGRINLIVKEPLTKEKLWAKSVSLEEKAIPITTTTYKASSRAVAESKLANDVVYKNRVYEALNDYYQKSLSTSYNHLDPRELSPLKKQVKALRKKKGY